ncbi:uncharacterized protein LOC111343334, partial [Stylophora pistillata]|uniref:uncharacterized protein LOC111343334 n=1 Tax=Stylophora pistillata TaxID=50429 RepID=UPI000C04B50F
QENSDQSESQSICHIYHSSGKEALITQCYCSGLAKHAHAACLLTWFKKEVKITFELCWLKIGIKKKGKPFAEIWFTVFVVGLFLNLFSISVSAAELCTSAACVIIFKVVNGFGIILDAAILYCWWTKCLFYRQKWFTLNQERLIVVGIKKQWMNFTNSPYSLNCGPIHRKVVLRTTTWLTPQVF